MLPMTDRIQRHQERLKSTYHYSDMNPYHRGKINNTTSTITNSIMISSSDKSWNFRSHIPNMRDTI